MRCFPGTNLRERRQRVDIVGVNLDQIIHEEEQQRRPFRHRAVFLARDSNADLSPKKCPQRNELVRLRDEHATKFSHHLPRPTSTSRYHSHVQLPTRDALIAHLRLFRQS